MPGSPSWRWRPRRSRASNGGGRVRIGELDEVTYDLEVDGELVRRMLHRRVWERRGWATVAIAYEERGADGAWKPAKLALIRLQRARGAWKKHASITLAGAEAMGLAEAIGAWGAALAPGAGEDDGDDGRGGDGGDEHDDR